MKKRINTGFMLIAAIAIVVTAVCSMFLFYQILEEQIFDDLKASAHVVSVISPNELSKDITYSLEIQYLAGEEWEKDLFYYMVISMTVWKMLLPWRTIRNARKLRRP